MMNTSSKFKLYVHLLVLLCVVVITTSINPSEALNIYSTENAAIIDIAQSLCKSAKYPLTQFQGVSGYLTPWDCAALFAFANYSAHKWKQDEGLTRDHVLYAETGSFMGLSAHIIAAAAKRADTSILIYSHDLFDMGIPLGNGGVSIWDQATNQPGNKESRLASFYSNVKRNKLTNVIIPIVGKITNIV
jgi:hypothetical protein